MFNISPAPAALAKRASKALSSAKLMFSRCRPPLGLDLSALSPPRSYAICARFTVLSEAPIASAIAGCVIPPSRSSTIWMRWRRFGLPFQRSAVFNRRTWALVHLTISSPESDDQRESQAGSLAKGSNSRTPAQKRRFNQLWSRYELHRLPADPAGRRSRRRHGPDSTLRSRHRWRRWRRCASSLRHWLVPESFLRRHFQYLTYRVVSNQIPSGFLRRIVPW